MQFPKLHVAHLPTPFEPLDRLSARLGGPRIWMKRDDCTGLATGGNKTRKLEYLMADALHREADTVITVGAVQSNHARQTAAFAARLGLKCLVYLETRLRAGDPNYNSNGNMLLDRLFGAEIAIVPAGADADALMAEADQRCREAGSTPYVIPTGGSTPVGALGYVQAAGELYRQVADLKLNVDEVVLATGSAGTQAGLLVGFRSRAFRAPVWGVSVGKAGDVLEAAVLKLALSTADLVGLGEDIGPDKVAVSSDYVGEGYGKPTAGAIEAVRLLAQTEGILLDPVYTGKAMAGLIDRIRGGHYRSGQNIVFWHTGGGAGLFAYVDDFAVPDGEGARATRLADARVPGAI